MEPAARARGAILLLESSITTECVTRITSDDEKMCTMEA